MTTENHPAGQDPIVKDVFTRSVDYAEADSQPILDEYGNDVIDEYGNVIDGEPAH